MRYITKIARRLGLATKEDLLLAHRLSMISVAKNYDLWSRLGRRKSNRDLCELFFGLVRVTQPNAFIEAGAKTAETSIRVRQYLPKARIAAFEANPEIFNRYKEDPKLAEKRVEYRHMAVTDYDGEIEFRIMRAANGVAISDVSGGNSIHTRASKNIDYDVVKSPCIKLDSFFVDRPRNALWIDVEGASKQVLTGARHLLTNTTVAIIEVEDYEVWEGQWTTEAVTSFLYAYGLVPVARDFEFNGQHNIVFVNSAELMDNKEAWRTLEYYYSVSMQKSLGESSAR